MGWWTRVEETLSDIYIFTAVEGIKRVDINCPVAGKYLCKFQNKEQSMGRIKPESNQKNKRESQTAFLGQNSYH